MYQMNEGTLLIPQQWRDESLHVFVLPGDNVNLVMTRSPFEFGLAPDTVYQQTLSQFAAHLKGYQELANWEMLLDGQAAPAIEYTWRSTEGLMHQVVVLQARGPLLLTFTITAANTLLAEQKQALLDVIATFKAAG